jgi:hypothetical protein
MRWRAVSQPCRADGTTFARKYPSFYPKERIMKRALLLVLLGVFGFIGLGGCEANVDAHDHPGHDHLKVDVDAK